MEQINPSITIQGIQRKESLSIVLPVYNEEAILEANVLRLISFMKSVFHCEWEIVIADNFSTDNTSTIGQKLADSFSEVKYMRINRRGVGVALKTAWDISKADIQCHVDGDLPFDFEDMKRVINGVQAGYDVCFGSRFIVGSSNDAKILRRLLSQTFHYWIKLLFSYNYSDICGIKAVRKRAFSVLSPYLTSNGWFFNIAFMLLANRLHMSIKEVPVRVMEPPGRKSKVKLLPTVLNLFVLTTRLKLMFLINGSINKSNRAI
jgi:glycosyltransferase involved in cell wall biosynthesis